MPVRRRNAVDPLALRAGDYVVHEQHGVGRYVEMTSRTVAGATMEYLVIEYAAAKRGLNVVVLDAFGPAHRNGSSHGSARIFRRAYPDPLYVRLRRRG